MDKKLTEAAFNRAAVTLSVDVAAIKAVTEVESKGSGFMASGEPVILFERHVFYKLLKLVRRDTDGLPPDLVNSVPGGYGVYSIQHDKLKRAVEIDRDCALQSCSWGLFQIMGYHWKTLGYTSLQEFINAMYTDEGAHLDAFVRFIRANPAMHNALRNHDWAKFARLYNGPAYEKNKYDLKLLHAHARYAL